MNITLGILFFLALAGNIVLPSFGLWGNIAAPLFLVLLLLYCGLKRPIIWVGLGCALIVEAFSGVRLGTLAFSFLLLSAVLLFGQKFINIKPLQAEEAMGIPRVAGHVILATTLFAVLSLFIFLTESLLHGAPLDWRNMPLVVSPGVVAGYSMFTSLAVLAIVMTWGRKRRRY